MLEILSGLDMQSVAGRWLSDVCSEVRSFPDGTVAGVIRGGSSEMPLAVVSHYDRPRFRIASAPDGGWVKLAPVGEVKAETYMNCTVVSASGVKGFIGRCGDGVAAYVGDLEEGALGIGDTLYVYVDPTVLADGTVCSPFCSCAVPAYALASAARRLAGDAPERDVYFILTAEGQYDFKQYFRAVSECGAAYAVCVGAVDESSAGGGGAWARLCDRSFSSDGELSALLTAAGAAPLVLSEGSCAASTVQRNGIPAAQLDVPVRLLGTARECVKLSDVGDVTEVLVKLCSSFGTEG